MSIPQTAQNTVIDIPFLGMNSKDSYLTMPEGYSPWLENVDTDGQKISVRNGFDLVGTINATDFYSITDIAISGEPSDPYSKMFLYAKPETGKPVTVLLSNGDGTFATSFTTSTTSPTDAYSSNYKSATVFSTLSSGVNDARYDGTNWTSIGLTYGGNKIESSCITEYRGRVYLLTTDNLYYSAVGAVTGACTQFPVSDFKKYSSAMWNTDSAAFVASISNNGNVGPNTLLALGWLSGEILVYAGDYPASATWGLVGKYKIPPISSRRSVVEKGNDIFITTYTGVVSLRALIDASKAPIEEDSPTQIISKYWKTIKPPTYYAGRWYDRSCGCFWPERNKIFYYSASRLKSDSTLDLNVIGDENWAHQIWVYDIPSRAWTVHTIPTTITNYSAIHGWPICGGLTYFQDNVYFFCGRNLYKYGTGYMDSADPGMGADTPISWRIKGRHLKIGKPGQIKGWEPLIKIDHASTGLHLKTSIDIDRVITAPSSPGTIDGINSLSIMNGGTGTFFQYEIFGETNSNIVGPIELYSMGVIA